jgi:hypothetical protein
MSASVRKEIFELQFLGGGDALLDGPDLSGPSGWSSCCQPRSIGGRERMPRSSPRRGSVAAVVIDHDDSEGAGILLAMAADACSDAVPSVRAGDPNDCNHCCGSGLV